MTWGSLRLIEDGREDESAGLNFDVFLVKPNRLSGTRQHDPAALDVR